MSIISAIALFAGVSSIVVMVALALLAVIVLAFVASSVCGGAQTSTGRQLGDSGRGTANRSYNTYR